jgi:hypothetical protein
LCWKIESSTNREEEEVEKMVLETEIIYQQSVLDVKYHLCVSQENGVKVEVSPVSNVVPIFSQVRVSSESISTEKSLFESVCFLFF